MKYRANKAKSAFWGMFDSTVTLTLDLLTQKFDAFIHTVKSISGESSVNKYPIYCANNVCSGLTHARTHEHFANIMSSLTRPTFN